MMTKADAQRNLELLQQLGMLGPKKKKTAAAKKPKKKNVITPSASRVSARLKGEVPGVGDAGAAGVGGPNGGGKAVVYRVFQERGLLHHSYRNIVSGEPETYSAAVAARLVAEPPETAPELPEQPQPLAPEAQPCSHCELRVKGGWLSECAKCASPEGRLCAACLWRRYGEARPLREAWECPHCRGLCTKGECRERRGWGALGDSCYGDARAAGFLSVAHWVVLRRTDVVLDSDVQEAIPNRGKRGRPLGGGGEIAKRVKSVQRSASIGQMPMVLVAGVVTDLGSVPWDRPGYVTADYFFPIGFRALRLYPTDASNRVVIEMTIVDGGAKPLFRARAMDRPEQVYEGYVSSAPLVELLTTRTSKFRTISGPRMMYLDDAMVRAALHTRAMSAFEQALVPPTYRHMHAFYGVLAIRRGAFVAVRAAEGFHLARALEDCFIMRADPQTYAFACSWCEEVDEDERCYVLDVGRDNVLQQTVFHLFAPGDVLLAPDGRSACIADHVPDIAELSNDLY